MTDDDHPVELYKFYYLLLCFQCQRIPIDLISRACEPKATWSSSGEIVWTSPIDGGVPQWLIHVWEARGKLLNNHDGVVPDIDGLEVVSDRGIRYFEFRMPDDDKSQPFACQNQEISTYQCICILIHAFPCRSTEVLAEEVAVRLLPLVEAFLLPLLASVSAKDIGGWFLPEDKRNIEWTICLFDCLQQIFIYLGAENPLLPLYFPRKVLDVFSQVGFHNQHSQKCLTIFVDMVNLSTSPLPETFEHSVLSTVGHFDERSSAWAGISLLMLLSNPAPRTPASFSSAISQAITRWRPVSMTNPSAMEYLVAIEILPDAQLQTIPLPTSLDTELSMIRGFLLSRKGSHAEAARAFSKLFRDAIKKWGLTSFQVGIAAAESANCYNGLRQESVAKKIATKVLATRKTPELTSREDWFYLSLSLADSSIGSGEYDDADSALRKIMSQPSISSTVHMMSCLRLSQVRRRTTHDNRKAFKADSPLSVGVSLFDKVPHVLREQYLEEVAACNLSETANTACKDLRAQSQLIDKVNGLLKKDPIIENPAQIRYAKVQHQLKQRIAREDRKVQQTPTPLPQAPKVHEKFFSISQLRNANFCPRPEIKALADLLLCDASSPPIINVHGKVGIGKTSLVAEFVYSYHRHHWDVVQWVESGSPEEPIPAEDQASAVAKESYNKTFSGCLIVLDNVEDEVLCRFRSAVQRYPIIIISRAKSLPLEKWADFCTLTYMEIKPLDPEQAVVFLNANTTLCGVERLTLEEKRDLTHVLGQHPSAILRAALFISRHHLTVQRFIEMYKEAHKTLLIPRVVTREPHHHPALITLWFLEDSPINRRLPEIMAFIGTETPESFLWLNEACVGWIGYPQNATAFQNARDQLLEASLIWAANGRETLFMPKAVQTMLRSRMDDEISERTWYRAIDMLSDKWPCYFRNLIFADYRSPTHTRCSRLWPCALSLEELSGIGLRSIASHNVSNKRVSVLLSISWCAIVRRMHSEATSILDLISKILETEGVPTTLMLQHQCWCKHHRAWLAQSLMLGSEAQELFEECDSLIGEAFDSDSVDFKLIKASVYNGQGRLEREIGMISKSIGLYRQSLDILDSLERLEHLLAIYDEDRSDPTLQASIQRYSSTMRTNLGFALLLNGQTEDAEELLKQVSEIISMTSTSNKKDDTLSAFLYYGIAIATLVQGEIEEGVRLGWESLSMFLESSDENFLGIGDVRIVISHCYAHQSRFELAIEHIDGALAIYGDEIEQNTAMLAKVRLLRRQREIYIRARSQRTQLQTGPDIREFFPYLTFSMR